MRTKVYQAAAIPIRDDLVCMVSSRSGQRWVLPKGHIEAKQSAAEAALVESWEEAGLLGVVMENTVGTYIYEKYNRDHHVTVFIMKVTEVRGDWPERGIRQREWVTFDEAIRRVEESGLKLILTTLFREMAKADPASTL